MENCVHCFSSTGTHWKKTRGSTKQLLILHTCAEEGGSSLSLTESCQECGSTGSWTQAGCNAAPNAGTWWELFVQGEREKQSFALDLINGSPRSTMGRSAREKKKTEPCMYMNYVWGAFVGLGLCRETIIFRRIRGSRQYVFEGCNNGIMCYGDGHKCQYFPVYFYPHLHLCKFIQASPRQVLLSPWTPRFSQFLLIPNPFLILASPSLLPSCPVKNSSLLSISFPVCSDALGHFGKCRILPSGRW